MRAHTFSLSTYEEEANRSLCIQEKPGPHTEFQDSQASNEWQKKHVLTQYSFLTTGEIC